MVYLMCKNIDNSVELSIKSIYMISNLALLSLILALVICIVANLLLFEFYTLSYYESFFLSRNIIGGFLTLRITVYVMEKIYYLKYELGKLCEQLLSIVLCLMVLAFFYQVIFVIFGAVFLIFDAVDLIKIKCEFKHKKDSKVQSE